MRKSTRFGVAAALALALSATASFADNVKIAFIDPLSGPFAGTGTNGLHQYEFAAEELVNKQGGVLDGQMFEVVAFDNKISPKESLIQLQVAIDQGIRYIVQGNSSGVANALTDAINKHNRRNPESRVLFLNYSAVDPALTNDKCNFWHFRFDANADIKMDALTDVIAADDNVKKVYIIGQDYVRQGRVAAANRMPGRKAPRYRDRGRRIAPIGKVKDFTPYARKIVASGRMPSSPATGAPTWWAWASRSLKTAMSGRSTPTTPPLDGITAAFGEAGEGALRLVAEGRSTRPCPTAQPPITRRSGPSTPMGTSARPASPT
jgi:branched-chain amino acid transport system substrate-binding protein